MKTIRAKVLDWWNGLSFEDKHKVGSKNAKLLGRSLSSLTGSEIENLWWAEMEANSEQFHKENPAGKETTVKNQQTLKNEMINAFIEYSTRIYPEDGYSYKAVDESDFKDLVNELFRRFKIG